MIKEPLQICSADELVEYAPGLNGIPMILEKVYVTDEMMCFVSADDAKEAGEPNPCERIALIAETTRGKLAFLLKKSPLTLKSGSDTYTDIVKRILQGLDDDVHDVRKIVIESLNKLTPEQRMNLVRCIDKFIEGMSQFHYIPYPMEITLSDLLGIEDYKILAHTLHGMPACLRLELVREFGNLTEKNIQNLLEGCEKM